MGKRAILAGASGAVGSSLLQELLQHEDYTAVLVLVRKKLTIVHPKLKQLVLGFEDLEQHAAEITGDEVFCCLGTTQKQTPDRQQYRKIDYLYPLILAQTALANGAAGYHLVSAMGADPDSRLFYSRTKGEAEEALKALSYPHLAIYRPSLLDSERQEKRLAERLMIRIMRLLNPLLRGRLKKYRSIRVTAVARAMLNKSLQPDPGNRIYTSDQIQEISAGR